MQDYYCKPMYGTKQPPPLRVPVSKSGEHSTTHEMKQGNQQDLKLLLLALAVARCINDLPISAECCGCFLCQKEGINPHEGERHIQALVTG